MKTEERDEPLNPYAAPQWTETAAETIAASLMPDAERPGVPWEQPGPLNRRFFATTWLMYTAPRQFFQRMRLNGGIWMPALFNVLAVILAMLVLIAILELANGPGFAAARGDQFAWRLLCVTPAWDIGSNFLWALLSQFIMSLGGPSRGLRPTLRMVFYSGGAAALASAVPFVGALINLILHVFFVVVGIRAVHGCGLGRSLLAAVLPLVLITFFACAAVVAGLLLGLLPEEWFAQGTDLQRICLASS